MFREAGRRRSADRTRNLAAKTKNVSMLTACFIICRWMCPEIGPCRVLVLAWQFSMEMAKVRYISQGVSTKRLMPRCRGPPESSTTCFCFSFVIPSSGGARQLAKGLFRPRLAKTRPFRLLARICWARQPWVPSSMFRFYQEHHALAALRRTHRCLRWASACTSALSHPPSLESMRYTSRSVEAVANTKRLWAAIRTRLQQPTSPPSVSSWRATARSSSCSCWRLQRTRWRALLLDKA